MRVGEPYILRYATEYVKPYAHGGSIPVWHLPNAKHDGLWCMRPQSKPNARIQAVSMFDEPPQDFCKRCLKHYNAMH